MKSLARFIAQSRETSSVFMTERWPRENQLPGLMMMRILEIKIYDQGYAKACTAQQSVENMMLRNVNNAAFVLAACRRLRKSGFIPDVIYTTAQDGYGLYLRHVFPHARLVTRLDWLHPHAAPMRQDDAEQVQQLAYERVHTMFQLPLFADCALGISCSEWQKRQLGESFARKIQVIANGVDTRFFVPAPVNPPYETITFSCQGASATRGINTICQCLPKLLTLRPHSRVQIVSFVSRKNEASREQRVNELASLLSLSDTQRQRVSIVVSPDPAQYIMLLQQSTLYVYLTAPFQLSSGLMEAMSCGALVLASDTEAVREIVNHGENGLLCDGSNAHNLAFMVAETVAKAGNLQSLRRNARETILARYDIRVQLPCHTAAVLGA